MAGHNAVGTPSGARRCSADGKIALGLQSQTSVRQAASPTLWPDQSESASMSPSTSVPGVYDWHRTISPTDPRPGDHFALSGAGTGRRPSRD